MAPRREVAPYAPPPMHHDLSGALVRIVVVALILGGGWLGWQYYSSNHSTAGLGNEAQTMAESGSPTQSYPTPPAAELTATAPESASVPTPRRSPASSRSAPASEPVPPPTTTVEPSTTTPPPPAPIPPHASTQGG